MRHTVSALVENKPGVLTRIATLFAARGFNIDSLAVGETEDPTVSRMTIVVNGDEKILEQVEKQLNKLIDVVKVSEFSRTPHIERDLALIKVKVDKKNKIFRIVFSRPSEVKMGLAHGFKFNRNLLPKEAVEAMDKIALLARKSASKR